MFTAYFIHIHFANPGYSLEIRLANESAQQNSKQFFISAPSADEIASLF
jgi:hypothetical protein